MIHVKLNKKLFKFKNRSLVSIFFTLVCLYNVSSQTIRSGEIWPDNNGVHINAHGGGILFHNNTYYWYGEHKIEGEAGNRAHVGVHVYSSKDLYNWKDEGIALAVNAKDSTSDIAKGCILERPKVIFNKKTGKFVMWFHLELLGKGYDAARSGVAVSDKPVGPYTFIKSYRPNAGFWPVNVQSVHKLPLAESVKEKYCGGKGCLPAHVDSINILGRDFKNGQMARDMNLFLDDDGAAYHIYSSEENSTIHIAKLSDDYLSHSGVYARAFPNRYMEAPAILKRSDGTYYFIGSDCTGWEPNAARSASAKNILGPWTELGNPCVGKDSLVTFYSQSTFLLPIQGKKDAFIFMGDRWTPKNAIDGRYVWLPVLFKDNKMLIEWRKEWKWEDGSKSEGQLLFNGKDFAQWLLPEADKGVWKIIDGVIDCNPASEAQGDKSLWTEKEYQDFELQLEWRIKETPYKNPHVPIVLPSGLHKLDENGKVVQMLVPDSDAGIYLRGSTKSQVNIWCWPIGSGEVYGYRMDKDMPMEVRKGVTPRINADKNIGEWNKFIITLKGDRLSVELNGIVVIENAQLPNIPNKGKIGLQHHGHKVNGEWASSPSLVQFRNISIKEF